MSRVEKSFWGKIKTPIKVLAPMAGYTDAAFRLMCKRNGADVLISEMVSADAMAYAKMINNKLKIINKENSLIYNKVTAKKNHNTAELLSFFEAERPFVVQLFGKNPANFAKATTWITKNLKPDGIDINMGCPARKVVGSGHGGALLENIDLAIEIIEAVVKSTNLPVSVKTRLGWKNDQEILTFAPNMVKAGISAIIIHGRVVADGFSGSARWENIYKVKELFGDKLVVIGNGDLKLNNKLKIINNKYSERSALGLITSSQTTNNQPLTKNLDGYAIGRGAFGKPWIFGMAKNNAEMIIDKSELKSNILQHVELAYACKGEHGIIEFRKHLLAYLKGLPKAKELKKQAVLIKTPSDIAKIIELI